MIVTLGEDCIMVEAFGNDPVPFLAESESKFFKEDDENTMMEFVKDEEGKIVNLIMSMGQDGKTMKGKKIK